MAAPRGEGSVKTENEERDVASNTPVLVAAAVGVATVILGLGTAMWRVHTTAFDGGLLGQQLAFTVASIVPFGIAIRGIKHRNVARVSIWLLTSTTVLLYVSFLMSNSSTAGLILLVSTAMNYGIVGVALLLDRVAARHRS